MFILLTFLQNYTFSRGFLKGYLEHLSHVRNPIEAVTMPYTAERSTTTTTMSEGDEERIQI